MTYKSYELYKYSGLQWIGDIPEHWDRKKIKYTTYVKGRIGWQGLKSDEFIEEGPYLVTGTDFENGLINWDKCYHISEKRYKEAPAIHLKENDLLITKDGSIGKLAMVISNPEQALLNSGIFVTRPLKNEYYSKYLYWVLESNVFKDFITYYETGTTIKHLYQEIFANFSYPFPNKKEQINISNFLDIKCSKIDQVIDLKIQQIETLQHYCQSLITETVSKGLNPNIKMKKSGVEWIGDIPEEWKIEKLKYIGKFYGGGTPSKDIEEYWNGDIPWVSPKDMKVDLINTTEESITEKGLKNSTTLLIKNKAVLLVVRSGILKRYLPVAINRVPVVLNQDMKAIIPCRKVSVDFLFWYFKGLSNYILYSCKKDGATVDSIELEELQKLKIAIPAREEQEHISNYLTKKTTEIDALKEEIKNQIQILKEYRQSLIYEAVTGKIDVRNYNESELEVNI